MVLTLDTKEILDLNPTVKSQDEYSSLALDTQATYNPKRFGLYVKKDAKYILIPGKVKARKLFF